MYNEEDCGKFKTIVGFECRGMEPIEFSPRVNDALSIFMEPLMLTFLLSMKKVFLV